MSELKTVSEELLDSNQRVTHQSELYKANGDKRLVGRIRQKMDFGQCHLRVLHDFHQEKFESKGFVMKKQYMLWDSCVNMTLKELSEFYRR